MQQKPLIILSLCCLSAIHLSAFAADPVATKLDIPVEVTTATADVVSTEATSVVMDTVAEENAQVIIDADHDGVADDLDKCLDTPQIKKIDPNDPYAAVYDAERRSDKPMSIPVDETGCAKDQDGDGVVDYKDFCPDDTAEAISAGVHTNGCPIQSDGDGTPDYRDKCPGTARGIRTDRFGCPVAK